MFAPKVARAVSQKGSHIPPAVGARDVGGENPVLELGAGAPAPARDFSSIRVCPAACAPLPYPLQRKLVVGHPHDPLEREADRLAAQAMGSSAAVDRPASTGRAVGRQCAACSAAEEEEPAPLRRAAISAGAEASAAPAIVHDVIRSAGEPLDSSARSFFEARFRTDFSRVRVHAGARAAASAQAVKARAYAVGEHIAFGPGEYRPASHAGRQLIAHELAHVVQQGGAGQAGGETATLRRADRDAVLQVMEMGAVVGAGVQFFPTNVTDTRIGPVSVQGGLLSHGASRLNIIVGTNLTPRILARQILPLWTTATPFTPPGGGPVNPPGALSDEQLAQGLLVYNQYYLPMPAMTQWRPGLHFPLPVEIDEATGMATVNPDVIRTLAASFDPAWIPALDQRAAATAAPAAATVQADVTAFLAQETTVLGRGTALAARAITNAQASLPFIREAFAQIGAGGFDVALQMMDTLVNRDIGLLAAQRDGGAILALIRTPLAAAPAALGGTQQASLTRANAMLARVAGVAAAAPSAAVPTRAEKTVTIDTVRLGGSSANPTAQVQVANMIFAQCNVRFAHGIDRTASPAQDTAWLGADGVLRASPDCGAASAEELRMFRGAAADFSLSARLRAFFLPHFTYNAAAYSVPRYCATGPAGALLNMIVVQDAPDTDTLAHEIGHVLINTEEHPNLTIMTGAYPAPNELLERQCRRIYANA